MLKGKTKSVIWLLAIIAIIFVLVSVYANTKRETNDEKIIRLINYDNYSQFENMTVEQRDGAIILTSLDSTFATTIIDMPTLPFGKISVRPRAEGDNSVLPNAPETKMIELAKEFEKLGVARLSVNENIEVSFLMDDHRYITLAFITDEEKLSIPRKSFRPLTTWQYYIDANF